MRGKHLFQTVHFQRLIYVKNMLFILSKKICTDKIKQAKKTFYLRLLQ